MSSEDIFTIAIDGPAGSGKGTIAKELSKILNYHYLDSGAIYRVIALAIHNKKLEFNQEKKIVELLKEIEISFEFDKTFLDGKDVSSEIREESISKLASKIAQNQELRKSLLSFQRSFAKKPGLVAEGRDMTTMVFPGADLKIYLDASVEERSKRRHKQLILKGNNVNIANLVTEIALRDKQDKERVHSPLVIDDEAHIINNDGLSVEETINKILALIISY
jgi:cytidylate kinase